MILKKSGAWEKPRKKSYWNIKACYSGSANVSEAQFAVFNRMFYCPPVASKRNALPTTNILRMVCTWFLKKNVLLYGRNFPSFFFFFAKLRLTPVAWNPKRCALSDIVIYCIVLKHRYDLGVICNAASWDPNFIRIFPSSTKNEWFTMSISGTVCGTTSVYVFVVPVGL